MPTIHSYHFTFRDGCRDDLLVGRYEPHELCAPGWSGEHAGQGTPSLTAFMLARNVQRVLNRAGVDTGADKIAHQLIQHDRTTYVASHISPFGEAEQSPLAYAQTEMDASNVLHFDTLEVSDPVLGRQRCRTATAAIIACALAHAPESNGIVVHSRNKGIETRSLDFFTHELGMYPADDMPWGQYGSMLVGQTCRIMTGIRDNYPHHV